MKDIYIKTLYTLGILREDKNDFSRFFSRATASQKKKVIKEAIRSANTQQKKLISDYDRTCRSFR